MFFHVPKFLRARAAVPKEATPNELRPPRLRVRWMLRCDMPAVLAIEREAFEFPWREEDFVRVLRQHNVIGMVADDLDGGRVAGFVIYENLKTRLHVLNLATAADARRRGVARAMIGKLASKLTPRRPRMLLEVRETNLGAQQCFRRLGFRAIAVLRDFYEEAPEDAYLFEYRVPSSRFQVPRSRFEGEST